MADSNIAMSRTESPATQSFHTVWIIVTLPSGMTCLVAAGQAYEEINEELEPTGMKL